MTSTPIYIQNTHTHTHTIQEKKDLDDPLWSAKCLLSSSGKHAIRNVHKLYFDAGADIAITATYQTTSKVLRGKEDLAKISVKLAREAAGKRDDVVVACSVGPYGAILHDGSEYTGAYGKNKDAFEFLRNSHS